MVERRRRKGRLRLIQGGGKIVPFRPNKRHNLVIGNAIKRLTEAQKSEEVEKIVNFVCIFEGEDCKSPSSSGTYYSGNKAGILLLLEELKQAVLLTPVDKA